MTPSPSTPPHIPRSHRRRTWRLVAAIAVPAALIAVVGIWSVWPSKGVTGAAQSSDTSSPPATDSASPTPETSATASDAASPSPAVGDVTPTPTKSKTALSTGQFRLLPPGSTLPSGAQCATAVRAKSIPENKGVNATANRTTGHTVPNARGSMTRVDGNFTGTTEQVLRWAACKWGVDEDMVKAQTAIESWWRMDNKGDWGTDAARCPANHGPGADGTPGKCPESYGLLQVRYPYNVDAFPGVENSSAMNADWAYGVWRECFEGKMTWLNTVERGSEYAAGDAWGCMGTHFSGRWHTAAAEGYIGRVKDYLAQRIWTTPNFQQP